MRCFHRLWALPCLVPFIASCSSGYSAVGPDASLDAASDPDVTYIESSSDALAPVVRTVGPGGVVTSITHACSLPGSIRFDGSGLTIVDGLAPGTPDLSFLHLPPGFCVHYFATVPNARQLRFAPGGELFVSSPTMGTTGGGPNSHAAVWVIPDDNGDGMGDAPIAFLDGAEYESTQGLLFANGQFYYQDHTKIMAMPYAPGQRAAGGATLVADVTIYSSPLHWPKTFDMADDGTIYAGNGGDQDELCELARPFHGGILKLDGTDGGTPVVKGLRNPIAVRCWRGHGTCFALELAKDYSTVEGGREKILPIHSGDDWGFPCCATQNVAYTSSVIKQDGGSVANADCAAITADTDSLVIGDTPFGLDFEPGQWPSPWTQSAIVATHGAAGSWSGARVVAIGMDPATGQLLPGSNTSGTDQGAMRAFATGWDDQSHRHGRPAAVTFSSDGRLFLSNDNNGVIVWIAPTSL